jgi:hypothetical protein
MKYSFSTTLMTPLPDKKDHFKVHSIEVEADNLEDAYTLAEPQIPEGHRIWSWYVK